MTSALSQVELGGAVVLGLESRIQQGVVAFGHRDGRPFAAWVAPDCAVHEAVGLPPVGAVTSMCVAEDFSAVVGDARPAVLFGDFASRPGVFHTHRFQPSDIHEVSEMAARFWVLCGDEDEFQLVLTGTGRLVTAECEVGELNLDTPALHLHGDEDRLVVGADDANVFVAGPVRLEDGTTSPLWSCATVTGYGGWQAWALDDPPDTVTDVRSGISALAAGTRDGRAVVHRIREREPVDVPHAELDGSHPMVLADDRMLAVQTSAGPRLWLDDTEHVLPAGRLDAARRDSTGCAWAVVDGSLYRVG